MASKNIIALFEQDRTVTERDLIKFHFLSGGKTQLTDKAKEVLERAERVKEILIEYRGDIKEIKNHIKVEFGCSHRMEVERLLEDAVYLYGLDVTSRRPYQLFITLQDIEWGIKLAKETKDLKALNDLLKTKTQVLRLDEPEETDYYSAFHNINIYMEYNPDNFKHAMPEDWQQRAMDIKHRAMKELGLIEDIPHNEIEFTNEQPD